MVVVWKYTVFGNYRLFCSNILPNYKQMKSANRREFLKCALVGCAAFLSMGCLIKRGNGVIVPGLFGSSLDAYGGSAGMSESVQGKEAMYYTPIGRNRVRCELCYHTCSITVGRRGFCRNRENRRGKLYNVVYGRPSAVNIDPIEKEPQHHMLPGTQMICIGTAGCNFRCRHCHNWHLSQRSIEELGRYYNYTPQDIVDAALELGLPTISSTYNEPTVFYEYVLDIAKLAKEANLRILWHSNGYIRPEPLKALLRYTDAVTIDLKGFSRKAYDNSSAELQPVLTTLKTINESNTWLEIVNLVIPTINDSAAEIREMCVWIRDELSGEVPVHFSRFSPNYQLTNLSPTPVETLERAYDIAREVGLHYVTLGNVPGHKYNSTFCPKCNETLIRRVHFNVMKNNIKDGKCASCGHKIPGIWT